MDRHPHVFGDVHITDPDEILEQWQALKKKEKTERKSRFDGIPKHLPALARAYELASKGKCQAKSSFADETQLGQVLWELAKEAAASGLNPELALRQHLMKIEEQLRSDEKK